MVFRRFSLTAKGPPSMENVSYWQYQSGLPIVPESMYHIYLPSATLRVSALDRILMLRLLELKARFLILYNSRDPSFSLRPLADSPCNSNKVSAALDVSICGLYINIFASHSSFIWLRSLQIVSCFVNHGHKLAQIR